MKAFLRTTPYLLLPLLLVTSGASCAGQKAPAGSVRESMRDAAAVSSELFTYVWAPEKFEAQRNERRILGMLDRLIADFHGVESAAPLPDFEPGFRIALGVHQDLLKDARARFAAGEKDYANWRLRAIATNCVACHSRWEAPADFMAVKLPETDRTIEGRLAKAEFLFATRQFDAASDELLRLARELAADESSRRDAFRALQSWLVIHVRVKQDFANAAEALLEYLARVPVEPDRRVIIEQWIRDLRALEGTTFSGPNAVNDAKKLLEPVQEAEDFATESKFLVTTLRATQLLHQRLPALERGDEKRQATYLLAMAYLHVPIPLLDTFKELYLEQCIREFPLTDEARRAYYAYSEEVELEHTGSGGLHLDEEHSRKLEELRRLAFGGERPTAADT